MGVGKYSPTVTYWYVHDQKWHEKHCAPDEWIDRDGYDSYGYHHETEKDRAGYTEYDYLLDGKLIHEGTEHQELVYDLYDMILSEWYGRPPPGQK